MTWTKLDDGFYDHPKVLNAGNAAAGVFARALSYCGKHNTDGFITSGLAYMLAGADGQALIDKLISTGLWKATEGGFMCDYLQYNPSRAEVSEERRKTAARVRAMRERRKKCNTVTSPVSHASPSRPVPSRPNKEEVILPSSLLTDHETVTRLPLVEVPKIEIDVALHAAHEASGGKIDVYASTDQLRSLQELAKTCKPSPLSSEDFKLLGEAHRAGSAWPWLKDNKLVGVGFLVKDGGRQLFDGLANARAWKDRQSQRFMACNTVTCPVTKPSTAPITPVATTTPTGPIKNMPAIWAERKRQKEEADRLEAERRRQQSIEDDIIVNESLAKIRARVAAKEQAKLEAAATATATVANG